jgi:hypothetical protein
MKPLSVLGLRTAGIIRHLSGEFSSTPQLMLSTSAEWGLAAMRTVWLALFCLIALAAALAVIIGMFPSANADVPQPVRSSASDVIRDRFPTTALPLSAEGETIGTSAQSDTLTRADRLERSHEITSVKSIAVQPAETQAKLSDEPEKIMRWHWHDPLDKPKATAIQPSAKRKSAKASATPRRIADQGMPTR